VLEYRRVLFLDPGHERARAHLSSCGVDTETRPRTVEPKSAVAGTPTRVVPAAGSSAPPKTPAPVRRVPAWTYAVIAALVIGGSLFAWRGFSHSGRIASDASDTGGPVALEVINDATQADSGKTTMSAATLDAPIVPVPEPGDATDRPAVVQETSANKPPEPAASQTAAKEQETPKLAPDLRGNDTPARATAPVTKPAEPPAPGSLSVYFLGGVGEVWVDGKLFARQPPFEKAAIAAGAHRIECRMSGETSKQSLNVTIRPNQETVIEYEVGGRPTISEE
jgi:hypothetical protein